MKTCGYLIIEGGIGAGKSTLAKALTRQFTDITGKLATCILEPDESSNPYLGMYYADPARWAFTMQMHLLQARYKATQRAQWGALNDCGWFVMDRSYFGDLCFAQVQKKDGLMSADEFNTYVGAHKAMQTNIHFPTVAIFLRCDVDRLVERINRRMSEKAGRACESSISRDYLIALQNEINRLESFMKTQTHVESINWNAEKSDCEIESAAREIALRCVCETSKQSCFYNPWGACANALFEV